MFPPASFALIKYCACLPGELLPPFFPPAASFAHLFLLLLSCYCCNPVPLRTATILLPRLLLGCCQVSFVLLSCFQVVSSCFCNIGTISNNIGTTNFVATSTLHTHNPVKTIPEDSPSQAVCRFRQTLPLEKPQNKLSCGV